MLSNEMIELSNKQEFHVKFDRNPRHTINWIFAAKLFLRLNSFRSTGIRFNKIFRTLPYDIQCSFMLEYGVDDSDSDDNDDDDNLEEHQPNTETVENVFKYLLQRFKPPPLKHHFIRRLTSDIQKLNEDPLLAWERYCVKLKKTQKSIKLINKGRANDDRILPVSPEVQINALKGIFVRKNNKERYGNKGIINKLTVNYIVGKAPKTVADWNAVFTTISTELISDLYDGMCDYEFIPYKACESDYDIYINHDNTQNKFNSKNELHSKTYSRNNYNHEHPPQKRNRILNNDSDNEESIDSDEPPLKRQKTDEKSMECYRCYKYIRDIDGNFINDEQTPKCDKCGKHGHNTWTCYSETDEYDNINNDEYDNINNDEYDNI
eukprot:499278_1